MFVKCLLIMYVIAMMVKVSRKKDLGPRLRDKLHHSYSCGYCADVRYRPSTDDWRCAFHGKIICKENGVDSIEDYVCSERRGP